MKKQLKSTKLYAQNDCMLVAEYTINLWLFKITIPKAVYVNPVNTQKEIESIANRLMYE